MASDECKRQGADGQPPGDSFFRVAAVVGCVQRTATCSALVRCTHPSYRGRCVTSCRNRNSIDAKRLQPAVFRNVSLTMAQVLEINQIDQLAPFRRQWGELLTQTAGASFFQSLEWLEVYWRHFGQGQRLRTMVVLAEDRPVGILPLVVRSEATKVGSLRVLTFPLHDWGSFYGPIGPEPALDAGRRAGARPADASRLGHSRTPLARRPGHAVDCSVPQAMFAAGFQAYPTVWDQAAIVDLSGTWESYWARRKGAWLRRFRHAEHKLAQQGEVSFVRYRPLGKPHDDGSPRWDLYDACEELARRSWQGEATNGTTLSHEAVRGFFAKCTKRRPRPAPST